MPKTRCELIVKEVFRSDSTWDDIEKLFSIYRRLLKKDLESFFYAMPDGKDRMRHFEERLEENECKKKSKVDAFERI